MVVLTEHKMIIVLTVVSLWCDELNPKISEMKVFLNSFETTKENVSPALSEFFYGLSKINFYIMFQACEVIGRGLVPLGNGRNFMIFI